MLQSNSFRFGMIYLRVVFWEINQLCNWGYSVILQKNQLRMLYLVWSCLHLGQLVVHIRVPTILRFLAHQNLYYITIRFPNRPSVNHFFILQRPFWVLLIKTKNKEFSAQMIGLVILLSNQKSSCQNTKLIRCAKLDHAEFSQTQKKLKPGSS